MPQQLGTGLWKVAEVSVQDVISVRFLRTMYSMRKRRKWSTECVSFLRMGGDLDLSMFTE